MKDISLMVVCFVISGMIILTGCSTTVADSLVTILNPEVATSVVEKHPLTPRLDNLDNKTIWFIHENWGDPDSTYILFDEMKEWFAENHPTTKIEYRLKKGMFLMDDPALWKEMVSKKVDAAVIGVAG